MANTITLSTDMRTLYLIDDDRAIPYNLETSEGVLIGTLAGQVTVISGKGATPTLERRLTNAAKKEIPLKDSQWTVTYNPTAETMFIIGAVEIEASIAVDKEPACKSATLNLLGRVLNIRKKGDMLEFYLMKQEESTLS